MSAPAPAPANVPYVPPPPTGVLTFQGVSKWFGGVSALKSIWLDVPPGLVGLLGPNGSGKTTFMRLASGLIKPSQGRVYLEGQPVWNNPDLYRTVGYATEKDAFYEFMTGLEFVAQLLKIHGYAPSEAEDRAMAAIQEVDLVDVAQRRCFTYSRGMRQRLKIAQAIAHDPRVLFLDEPLTGTDPIQRRRLKELIRNWGRQGRTVFISSHVLHEVEEVTRQFILIHKGVLRAHGDLDEIRGLIDRHPHTITMDVDEPRALAKVCCDLEEVTELTITDGVTSDEGTPLSAPSLTIRTHQPERFYGVLPGLLLDAGVDVQRIYCPDDNLEAVFRYLVQS